MSFFVIHGMDAVDILYSFLLFEADENYQKKEKLSKLGSSENLRSKMSQKVPRPSKLPTSNVFQPKKTKQKKFVFDVVNIDD